MNTAICNEAAAAPAAPPAERPALRIWGGPLRYVQGPGALAALGELVAPWGRRAVLVADSGVHALVGSAAIASCAAAGVALRPLVFNGEVTPAEVRRLAETAGAEPVDLVVAAGGGKGIDAGKALAHALGRPVVTLPTAASTDAPTSAIYVLYDDAHRLLEVGRLPHNPAAVLVDTALIAKAPAALLAAGIGDALSKRFEVAACMAAGGRNSYGGLSPLAAGALAEACDDMLLAHAAPALAAVRRGSPDAHLENLVEATVLLSGLCFESGGLSMAHALTRGLSDLPGPAQALHGLQVAWGLRVQWELEGRPTPFWQARDDFYRAIGLPMSLSALGLAEPPSAAQWAQVAQRTLAAPHARHTAQAVTPDMLLAAMQRVEQRAGQPHAPANMN